MLPLVRWTIGNSTPHGFECLRLSIESFLKFHEAEVVICHNCPTKTISLLCFDDFHIIDQSTIAESSKIKPIGVSWKLYPPRLDINRYEISIDNDIVFQEPIPEIEKFLQNDCTLLLEDHSRTYGRFERYVPPGFEINSGIYGMPPGFDLYKYVNFYFQTDWELNARGEYEASKTFDEQGLIALALLNYRKYVIISNASITNCERELKMAKGMHFIGLNRRPHHHPFIMYKNLKTKFYL